MPNPWSSYHAYTPLAHHMILSMTQHGTRYRLTQAMFSAVASSSLPWYFLPAGNKPNLKPFCLRIQFRVGAGWDMLWHPKPPQLSRVGFQHSCNAGVTVLGQCTKSGDHIMQGTASAKHLDLGPFHDKPYLLCCYPACHNSLPMLPIPAVVS